METKTHPRMWLAEYDGGPTIALIDGVAMNRKHPDTFEIPDNREGLSPGRLVKVGFEATSELVEHIGYEGPAAERMWVRIEEVRDDGTYLGTLQNAPFALPMTLGQIVSFGPEHILSIWGDEDA